MELKTLFKPYLTINLDKTYSEIKHDIEKMFKVQNEVLNSNNSKIRINATDCEYISPTCMIILSSVALISKEKSKDIKIVYKSNTKFHNFLKSKGFITIENTPNNNDVIPLNILTNEEDIAEVISNLISSSPLNRLDDEQKYKLQSKLYEIPINAFTHSHSTSGILYCGYYRNKKEFYFSVYDKGIGIPQSVRNYKKDNSISSIEALEWALTSGNSTKQEDFARGIGFTLLEEFRKSCKGKITIISEDVIYESTLKGYNIKNLTNKVPGTLFTFKIVI